MERKRNERHLVDTETKLYLRALTLLAYQHSEREDRKLRATGLKGQAEIDPNTPELQRIYLVLTEKPDNDNG
jgi:hypothetical protein